MKIPAAASRRQTPSAIGLGERAHFQQAILDENLLVFFLIHGFANPLAWPDRARPWIGFFARTLPQNAAGTPYTFADLGHAPKAPFLMLNSTDTLNDQTFSFVQERFNDLCADLNPVPVAVGVAAAGNFPYLSTDIELRNFRAEGPCE